MKKSLLIAGALVVVVLGAVVVAEARGPMGAQAGSGRGMMMGQGQGMMGQGQGMMGQGMMMGRGQGMMANGSCPMMNGGTFDPAAMESRMESMVAQHEAAIAALEAQLAKATDETVKTNLTARIEWQRIMLGHNQAHLALLPTLPADALEHGIAMAQADVAYFGQVTAADARNQAMVEARLAQAQQRLAALEAQATKQQN